MCTTWSYLFSQMCDSSRLSLSRRADHSSAEMKAEASRHQAVVTKEQKMMLAATPDAEDPWYEDEDMKDLVKNRPSALEEAAGGRKLTPEENMAVIRMYGGVQFPDGALERTPSRLLLKLERRGSFESKSSIASKNYKL